MEHYRMKPVVVQAIVFNEYQYRTGDEQYDTIPIVDKAMLSEKYAGHTAKDGRYSISTSAGNTTISEGDYIVKGTQGEFYVYTPELFAMLHERI